jgi:hypothetical protein
MVSNDSDDGMESEFLVGELSDDSEMGMLFRTNKFLHPKVKEVIVQLCWWFKPEDIAIFLDLHPETVKRIWGLYKSTGSVTRAAIAPLGRPQTLDWTQGLVNFPLIILF